MVPFENQQVAEFRLVDDTVSVLVPGSERGEDSLRRWVRGGIIIG